MFINKGKKGTRTGRGNKDKAEREVTPRMVLTLGGMDVTSPFHLDPKTHTVNKIPL